MKKRIISILLSVLVLSTFYCIPTKAIGDGKITITFEYEIDQDGVRKSIPIPNAKFNLYKIWSLDANEEIVVESALTGHLTSSELEELNSEELQKQAAEYERMVDDTTPIATSGTTNTNGVLVISGLEDGAYLFVQENPVQAGDEYCLAQSFLVTLPYKGVNGRWTRSVEISPKASILLSPEISKLVNEVELYGLNAKEEIFTYSIMTSIPTIDASSFVIRDRLENVLEFAPYSKASDIVSVFVDGEQLSITEVDEQTTLTTNSIRFDFKVERLQNQKGKPVRIEFKAKIKKDADLSNYVSGRVPNEACFAVGYETASIDTYQKSVELRNSSMYARKPGITVNYAIATQEKCSNKVYVYPKEGPAPTPTPTPGQTIPDTFAYFMDTVESNPWIAIVILLIVIIITRKVYTSYNNS